MARRRRGSLSDEVGPQYALGDYSNPQNPSHLSFDPGQAIKFLDASHQVDVPPGYFVGGYEDSDRQARVGLVPWMYTSSANVGRPELDDEDDKIALLDKFMVTLVEHLRDAIDAASSSDDYGRTSADVVAVLRSFVVLHEQWLADTEDELAARQRAFEEWAQLEAEAQSELGAGSGALIVFPRHEFAALRQPTLEDLYKHALFAGRGPVILRETLQAVASPDDGRIDHDPLDPQSTPWFTQIKQFFETHSFDDIFDGGVNTSSDDSAVAAAAAVTGGSPNSGGSLAGDSARAADGGIVDGGDIDDDDDGTAAGQLPWRTGGRDNADGRSSPPRHDLDRPDALPITDAGIGSDADGDGGFATDDPRSGVEGDDADDYGYAEQEKSAAVAAARRVMSPRASASPRHSSRQNSIGERGSTDRPRVGRLLSAGLLNVDAPNAALWQGQLGVKPTVSSALAAADVRKLRGLPPPKQYVCVLTSSELKCVTRAAAQEAEVQRLAVGLCARRAGRARMARLLSVRVAAAVVVISVTVVVRSRHHPHHIAACFVVLTVHCCLRLHRQLSYRHRHALPWWCCASAGCTRTRKTSSATTSKTLFQSTLRQCWLLSMTGLLSCRSMYVPTSSRRRCTGGR
jgi:hypothetical protein